MLLDKYWPYSSWCDTGYRIDKNTQLAKRAYGSMYAASQYDGRLGADPYPESRFPPTYCKNIHAASQYDCRLGADPYPESRFPTTYCKNIGVSKTETRPNPDI